jgi:hypothetical protein
VPALRYWLSWPPAERVAAVEYLRRQIDAATALPGGEAQRPEDCNGAETAPAGGAHGLNPALRPSRWRIRTLPLRSMRL